MEPLAKPCQTEHDHEKARRPVPTPIKLKSHRRHHRSRPRSPRRDDGPDGEAASSGETRSRHRRRRREHGHGRRRRSASPSNTPEAFGPPPLDPDAAFRESLFDAMADDEAASYWEGVYGQPIHVYSNEKVGAQGKLERMTDEEYAAHVRQRMFEKTHAGLLEEKARREAQRERDRQHRRAQDERARRSRAVRSEVEQSLHRGEARRLRREWDGLWAAYVDGWAGWAGDLAQLPWPVKGGRRRDVSEDRVRTFFTHGLDLAAVGDQAFAARLKEERVRWHPDKIQQRLGGVVDDGVMRDVTAVFQIIDGLRANHDK